MPNILENLAKKFEKATKTAFPDIENPPIELTQSKESTFGHYQFNSGMKLAKPLKKNPREVAQAILDQIHAAPEIEKVEIAGPGFINITLATPYIEENVNKIFKSDHLGVDPLEKKERIIVEFSSPNTAKELHVGHLRSTIIGECLARLLEFLGHDVLRLNHVGDWGTQFGMLIAHMKQKCPEVLSGEKTTDLTHLVGWYKESKARFDDDLDFKKLAQLEVVSLQGGNKESLKAWEILCTISRKAYQEIYDLLGVTLTERGESFYNPMLASTIEELEKKGLITLSDGAKCLFPPGFKNKEGDPLPLMLQKSDGGYGYDTTDMAAIHHRIFHEKVDRIIYVTDAGQSSHFQMIFKAAEMAGWTDGKQLKLDHVPFGLVLGSDGKKFKTRSGDTEKLIDLLNEAVVRAEAILVEKNPTISIDERKALAKALGIGAVKYADLSCNRTGDYTFSYDRMLRFEGNTAAYLMYVYVRVAGIKRKIGKEVTQEPVHLIHPSEIALGLHLCQFSEALKQVERDLLPNRLTDYLYTLAEKFNAFYRDCQVEGSKDENSRLLLCEACALIMKQGLHLIGVEVVERM
jgi:arginyl-tRNA synthetase